MNDLKKLVGSLEAVPLAKIQMSDATQTRAGIDLEHVAELRELLEAGGKFSAPVALFRDDEDRYWIGDGFHRVHATKGAKLEQIEADVRPGGQLEALRWGMMSNHRHGLKRTNEDKRHCVELALADTEIGAMSDALVADYCGVGRQFVNEVRNSGCRQATPCADKRVGRDGKTYNTPSKPRCPKCNCVITTKGAKYCDPCLGKGLAGRAADPDLTKPRKPLTCQPNLPITDRDEPEPRRSARLPKEKSSVSGSTKDVPELSGAEVDQPQFNIEAAEARVRELIYAERATWPTEYAERFASLIDEISTEILTED